MCHFRCPWNGMFDCHRAEITVMQFTGHSLPVHQSMTVPPDFTMSHFVSQARPCQWNMHFRRLWNGMIGRVEGQYTTFARLDFELAYYFTTVHLLNISATGFTRKLKNVSHLLLLFSLFAYCLIAYQQSCVI